MERNTWITRPGAGGGGEVRLSTMDPVEYFNTISTDSVTFATRRIVNGRPVPNMQQGGEQRTNEKM